MSQLSRLEDRIKNRRIRRWKRRGRILAPLLALPPLVGTLILSIDFIQYEPKEPSDVEKMHAVEQAGEDSRAETMKPNRARRIAISTSAVQNDGMFEVNAPALSDLDLAPGEESLAPKPLPPFDHRN